MVKACGMPASSRFISPSSSQGDERLDITIRNANSKEDAFKALEAIFKSQEDLIKQREEAEKRKGKFVGLTAGCSDKNGHIYLNRSTGQQINVWMTWKKKHFFAKIIAGGLMGEVREI